MSNPIPLVSIIIPVYNSEKHLAESILSAKNQTWQNKEIIIVDDGSTDSSLEIAKGFSSDTIIIITQKNNGACAARNNGLKHAKGDYIQFLDADDLLSPDKIEDQLKQLTSENQLSFCPNITLLENTVINEEWKWYMKDSDSPVDFLISLYCGESVATEYGGMITIHSWLSPRKLLDKAGPWNESLTVDDDGEYFCRVVLASSGIRYCETSFTYYRKSENNPHSLSLQNSRKALVSAITALDLKLKHLENSSNNIRVGETFAKHFWHLGIKCYPENIDLADYCINRYNALAGAKSKPKIYIGGSFIDFIANNLSWKLARHIQVYKNQLKFK